MKVISNLESKRELIWHTLELVRRYPASLWGGIRHKEQFKDVETYCMFIGYPRSGHSLIGSLIDAHPNAIIAHELHTLKYLLAGFGKSQIFYLLLKNSQEFTENGRKWSGYSYQVKSQWQGRFQNLQIMGDKKGLGSTMLLRLYPGLLKRLRRTINVNLKFFHVVRNPYDNISTIFKKDKSNLEESIEYYFSLCDTIVDVKKQLYSNELFEFQQEAFIDNPRKQLEEISIFLGIEATDAYLTDCESIIFKSPHKTRHKVQWDSKSITRVKERMADFSFLEGYSFED